ncbi:MAG: MerR family transcriptional regulator [Myxococcales bacterium]|jgi:DNA-binding transcriptional MerR regulator|nr:MerR family transcriptional regulator [Myxococcales bacterium]
MTARDEDQLIIAEIGPPDPPPSREPRARAAAPRRARRSAGEGVDLGSDKLYFKIGEVAQIVGVPAYVLRYWETEFKVLKPQKSRAQQRVYRRRDVETLLKIKHLLYAKKFTIAGARQQLRMGTDEVEMAPPASNYLASQSLTAVREALDDLIACVAAEPDLGSIAADPAAYIRNMGGARALVDQAAASGTAQPLLERPGREAI